MLYTLSLYVTHQLYLNKTKGKCILLACDLFFHFYFYFLPRRVLNFNVIEFINLFLYGLAFSLI